MKKIFILILSLQIFVISLVRAAFTPFITTPQKEELKIAGLREVGNILSFAFIQEDKSSFCYLLAEAYIDNKGYTPIILKTEINKDGTRVGSWELINPPTLTSGLLFKEIHTFHPLLIGRLGSQVALMARKDSFSTPNLYFYDSTKKVWNLAYDSSQKGSFIQKNLNDKIGWLTGSDTTWWINTCNFENKCTVFEMTGSSNVKKSRYVSASVTPDNQYAWFIEPMAHGKQLTLYIQDLNNPEFSTPLIDLPITTPPIKNLLAVDGTTAYFIDISYKLYEFDNDGKSTPIQTDTIGSINAMALLDKVLIVAQKNQLYRHDPQPEALNVTIKRAMEKNLGTKPVENKAISLEWQKTSPLKASTIQISNSEPVQGTPINISDDFYTLVKKTVTAAVIRAQNIAKKREEVQVNTLKIPHQEMVREQPKQASSLLQKFRDWLGNGLNNISAWLRRTKAEPQQTLINERGILTRLPANLGKPKNKTYEQAGK